MVFDPTTLSSQSGFVRASSLALADGAAVATVPDSSGAGHGLSFATQPIFKASVPGANGHPAIYFPGFRACTSAWLTLASVPYHVWAIVGPDLAGPNDNGYNWGIVGNPGGFNWLLGDAASSGPSLYLGQVAVVGVGPLILDGSFHLVEAWCDGVNTHYYQDGVDCTTTPTNGYTWIPGALAIGDDAGGHNYSGYLVEAMARTVAPSSGDRANLLAYFAQTYRPSTGLTVSPAASGGAGGSGVVVTVGYNGLTSDAAGDTLTVALADDGPTAGSFSPSSVTLSPTARTATSTYTPSAASPGLRTVAASCTQIATGTGLYSVPGSGTTTIAVTDPGLIWSPYTWYPGSGFLQSVNPGSYVRLRFGGTSISVALDVSAMVAASYAAGDYPTIGWSVDGGAWQTRLLASSDATVALASSLAQGTIHTLELIYQSLNNIDANSLDLWSTPALSVKITGFVVDRGCAAYAPSRRPNNVLIYSDSIGVGVNTLAFSGALGTGFGDQTSAGAHAGLAWPFLLGDMLDAEVGSVCFSAQGYGSSGLGGVPPIYSAWSLYSAGRSRLSGGLFSPAPTWIISGHGSNPNAYVTPSAVCSLISAWRAAAPSASIFFLVPYALGSAAQVALGVNAWKLSNPADPVYLIQSRAEGDFSHESGLHYVHTGHTRYAGRAATLIRAALDGAPPTPAVRHRPRTYGG